jgi:hypothetical protein
MITYHTYPFDSTSGDPRTGVFTAAVDEDTGAIYIRKDDIVAYVTQMGPLTFLAREFLDDADMFVEDESGELYFKSVYAVEIFAAAQHDLFVANMFRHLVAAVEEEGPRAIRRRFYPMDTFPGHNVKTSEASRIPPVSAAAVHPTMTSGFVYDYISRGEYQNARTLLSGMVSGASPENQKMVDEVYRIANSDKGYQEWLGNRLP